MIRRGKSSGKLDGWIGRLSLRESPHVGRVTIFSGLTLKIDRKRPTTVVQDEGNYLWLIWPGGTGAKMVYDRALGLHGKGLKLSLVNRHVNRPTCDRQKLPVLRHQVQPGRS
jgi:hypothetical protein